MKLTAIPFLTGAWGCGYFLDSFEFAIAATIISVILLLTKQMEAI